MALEATPGCLLPRCPHSTLRWPGTHHGWSCADSSCGRKEEAVPLSAPCFWQPHAGCGRFLSALARTCSRASPAGCMASRGQGRAPADTGLSAAGETTAGIGWQLLRAQVGPACQKAPNGAASHGASTCQESQSGCEPGDIQWIEVSSHLLNSPAGPWSPWICETSGRRLADSSPQGVCGAEWGNNARPSWVAVTVMQGVLHSPYSKCEAGALGAAD